MLRLESVFAPGIRAFIGRYGKKVLAAGLVVGTFAVLGFMIARDWGTLQQFQWHFRPSFLVFALCSHAISLGGTFFAWRLITNCLGSSMGAKTDFHIFFLSLATRKMPSALWYTGTRVLLYSQEGVSISTVVIATAIEFGVAVLTGGWVFVAFRPHYIFLDNYAWVGHGVLIITLALTGLFFVQPSWVIRWVRHKKEQNDSPNLLLLTRFTRSNLFICMLIYLAAWIVGGTSFYLTVRGLILDPGIDWINAIGVATLSTLAVLIGTALPVGVGLKEITAGVLLSKWLPMPVGLSVAIAYRILQMVDEAFWVSLAYFLLPKALKQGNLTIDNTKDNTKEVLH